MAGSDTEPLFLLYDGCGVENSYSRLFALNRTLWGIHDPKFATGEKWEGDNVTMANHYAWLTKSKLSLNEGCMVRGG